MNHKIQLIEIISFLFEIYRFLWINWLNKAYLNPKTIKGRRSIIINKRYKLIIFFLIWIIFNRHGLKFYYDEIINEHLLKKMLHVTHFVLFFLPNMWYVSLCLMIIQKISRKNDISIFINYKSNMIFFNNALNRKTIW